MARPTKLTPDVEEKIVSSIRAGNFRNTAVKWAGVGERTMREWMRRGERRPKSRYGRFRRRVMEAEKAAEMRCVALVMKAASEDAKHAEWWLERKYPQRWGKKERHEITGKGGGAVRARVEDGPLAEVLADAKLRDLLDQAAQRAAELSDAKSKERR